MLGALVAFAPFAMAHGGLDGQIAALSALIIRHPADADLLVKRSELYRTNRQYEFALADLDRATKLRRQLPAADLVRAHVLLDMGRLQGAVDAASRFLTAQPAHADALIVRGRARAKLGRAPDAAIDFTRALEVKAVPDWYVERARLISPTGAAGVDAALRGLDDGIRRLGPLVTLELEAIDLELRVGRHDAALARLDRVMVQAARKENFLARRGAILESGRRTAEARSAYLEALAAVQNLPPWTQRTPMVTALAERLRADVARLPPSARTHDQK